MFKHKVNKLPKNTYEIFADIPKDVIEKEYEEAFSRLQKTLIVEGFRQGKAPKTIAQKHIHKESVYQELMKTILPKIYEEIIKKEGLKPIISPKVELVKAKENEDWQIKFSLAEKPSIKLADYKELSKKLKTDKKKEAIWVPGKNDKQPDAKEIEQNKQKLLNDLLDGLIKQSKVEISDLVIETELNQRLAKLVDDIQKIGLSTESYLKSKNTSMEDLKKRYAQEITDTFAIEFILNEIADKENIVVNNTDLEKLFSNISNEAERKAVQSNAYFYATILKKQKTLDFLLGL